MPGMYERLKDSNSLLDEINKGLNAYLEKKRIFFSSFVLLFHLTALFDLFFSCLVFFFHSFFVETFVCLYAYVFAYFVFLFVVCFFPVFYLFVCLIISSQLMHKSPRDFLNVL